MGECVCGHGPVDHGDRAIAHCVFLTTIPGSGMQITTWRRCACVQWQPV
jgi:hypothetical protein